jgi:hypothetical protein
MSSVKVAAGLFEDFLRSMLKGSAEGFAGAAKILTALCSNEGCACEDFRTLLMNNEQSWRTAVQSKEDAALAPKEWAVICTFCSHANFFFCFLRAKPETLEWRRCLTTHCDLLDTATGLLETVLTKGNPMVAPCVVVEALLTHLRIAFERAETTGAFGAGRSASFAGNGQKLLRRLTGLPVPRDSNLLRQRDHAMVNLAVDLLATSRGPVVYNENNSKMIQSYHDNYPDDVGLRTKAYFQVGRLHLALNLFAEAQLDLSRAFEMCPPSETANRNLIFASLVAVGLPLGQLPGREVPEGCSVPEEFDDIITAVEAGDLRMYNHCVHTASHQYFLARNFLNAVIQTRSIVVLHMVIKYYKRHGCPKVIDLNNFIGELEPQLRSDPAYAAVELPTASPTDDEPNESAQVAKTLQFTLELLFPLFSAREIRGAIEKGSMVLSEKNPFPRYPDINSVGGATPL